MAISGKPCGIVTTTDILGAVSRFASESATGAETDIDAVV